MTKLTSVVLAGASGFMGRHLRAYFEGSGVGVRTIGRPQTPADAHWGDDIGKVLDGTDALINLAGRSVSCRYTSRTINEIFASRTETTAQLGKALARCANPPRVWLNSSTGTIYRDARDRPQSEHDGDIGSGFSVAVARAWEHELALADIPIRRVALRNSFVLGPDGGALAAMINLARVGLGGRQGDGGQLISWIHLDDLAAAIRHLITHDEVSGPVNLATTAPVTNAEFMAAVRHHLGGLLGTRLGLPLPAWALKPLVRLARSETELVLKSRWVHPEVLLASGFTFRYPTLDEALTALAPHISRGLLPVPLG